MSVRILKGDLRGTYSNPSEALKPVFNLVGRPACKMHSEAEVSYSAGNVRS
jgi:hypothetical protein